MAFSRQVTEELEASYADALARFSFGLQDKGVSDGTQRVYLTAATKFLAYLERDMGLVLPLDAVTKEHAREWVRSLRTSGLKPATVRLYYQSARQLFALAKEDGEVTDNPFDGLALPPVAMPETVTLSPEEVQAMVSAAGRDRTGFLWGKRDAAVIVLLHDTGLRANELLSVREEDIDWRSGALTVMGKGKRPRIVGLGAVALRALNRYLSARRRYQAGRPHWKNQAEDSPIWESSRGGSLSSSGLKAILEKRAREAGLKQHVHPHMFRHSAATAMAAEMPETELRAHFGWSANSPQVFRYTRSDLAARTVLRHRKNAPGDRLRL